PNIAVRLWPLLCSFLVACGSSSPKPCEADSDCGKGSVCLRESPTMGPDEFFAANHRDAKTLCRAVKARPDLPAVRDSGLYVGASKIDITPRGFETHNNIDDPVHCPKNHPAIF